MLYATAYALEENLDLRKVIDSHRLMATLFRWAMEEGFIDKDKAREAVAIFMNPSPKLFKDRCALQYKSPYPENRRIIEECQERYADFANKIAALRKEAFVAPLGRTFAFIQQLRGRKLHYEIDRIMKAYPAINELNESQSRELDEKIANLWRMNALWIEAVYLYERARCDVLLLSERFRKDDLGDRDKDFFLNLGIKDIGENPVISKALVKQYFESLKKTVQRWNKLGDVFRKLPFNLEDVAVREFHKIPPGERTKFMEETDVRAATLEEGIKKIGGLIYAARRLYRLCEEYGENPDHPMLYQDRSIGKVKDEYSSYPGRFTEDVNEPVNAEHLDNFMKYMDKAGLKKKKFELVDKTKTGSIADIVTIHDKMAILKALASRAPPMEYGPRSQSFQILINDIIRHEREELKTGSHPKALQVSYEYFKAHQEELIKLLKVELAFGIRLDDEYREGLVNTCITRQILAGHPSHPIKPTMQRRPLKDGKNLKKEDLSQEEVESAIKDAIKNGEAIGLNLEGFEGKDSSKIVKDLFSGISSEIALKLTACFDYESYEAKINAQEKLAQYLARSDPARIGKIKSSFELLLETAASSYFHKKTIYKRRLVILLTEEDVFSSGRVFAHAGSNSIYIHINTLNAVVTEEEREALSIILEHEDRDIINGKHADDIRGADLKKVNMLWEKLNNEGIEEDFTELWGLFSDFKRISKDDIQKIIGLLNSKGISVNDFISYLKGEEDSFITYIVDNNQLLSQLAEIYRGQSLSNDQEPEEVAPEGSTLTTTFGEIGDYEADLGDIRSWIEGKLGKKRSVRVLDFGASGPFLRGLKFEFGDKVEVIGVSKDYDELEAEGIVIYPDLSHLAAAKPFDVIVSRLTLKYVDDPANYIEQLFNLLSRGGIAALDLSGINKEDFSAATGLIEGLRKEAIVQFIPPTVIIINDTEGRHEDRYMRDRDLMTDGGREISEPQIYILIDHNEVFPYLYNSERVIAINWDQHADIYSGKGGREQDEPWGFFRLPTDSSVETIEKYTKEFLNIETFMAPLVVKEAIDEIYWVLPEWFDKKEQLAITILRLGQRENPLDWQQLKQGIPFYFGMVKAQRATKKEEKQAPILELYYFGPHKDKLTQESIEHIGSFYYRIWPVSEEEVKSIKVHAVFPEDLPNFISEERPRIVMWDLDSVNQERPEESIKNTGETLVKRNVRPEKIFIIQSPTHTPEESIEGWTKEAHAEILRRFKTMTTKLEWGKIKVYAYDGQIMADIRPVFLNRRSNHGMLLCISVYQIPEDDNPKEFLKELIKIDVSSYFSVKRARPLQGTLDKDYLREVINSNIVVINGEFARLDEDGKLYIDSIPLNLKGKMDLEKLMELLFLMRIETGRNVSLQWDKFLDNLRQSTEVEDWGIVFESNKNNYVWLLYKNIWEIFHRRNSKLKRVIAVAERRPQEKSFRIAVPQEIFRELGLENKLKDWLMRKITEKEIISGGLTSLAKRTDRLLEGQRTLDGFFAALPKGKTENDRFDEPSTYPLTVPEEARKEAVAGYGEGKFTKLVARLIDNNYLFTLNESP
ncbi:MAG: hypothetical protein NTW64_05320, partial [Candidatus Omnitrophica bacterium]|nr:hypothetical protein [Candidatus Omnitrophota bacterium]